MGRDPLDVVLSGKIVHCLCLDRIGGGEVESEDTAPAVAVGAEDHGAPLAIGGGWRPGVRGIDEDVVDLDSAVDAEGVLERDHVASVREHRPRNVGEELLAGAEIEVSNQLLVDDRAREEPGIEGMELPVVRRREQDLAPAPLLLEEASIAAIGIGTRDGASLAVTLEVVGQVVEVGGPAEQDR